MSQPNKNLRWGILGTSFISGTMAEAIIANQNSEIAAVAGRNEQNLTSFADQFSIATRYTSYDELLVDENVDIVYIALPNHLHHEYVVKAAKANKAILCEKSLSVDMEKTTQALEAVKESGVFFAEGLMYLNHPFAGQIESVVKSGELGEIKSINASYCAAISQFVNPDSKGTLYNLACYPVSLINLLLKSQLSDTELNDYQVSAFGRRGGDGNFCEISALIRYKNQMVVRVHSAEDFGLHSEFVINGSKKSLTLTSNPWLADKEDNSFVVTEYEQKSDTFSYSADGDGFYYQVQNIVDALAKGDKQLAGTSASAGDSYQIMQMLTRIESAAETSE